MNPQVGIFAGLLKNADSFILSSDLESGNLFSILANGVDEEKAEELREGLDSILGMGKMMAQGQLSQAAEGMPKEMVGVAKEVLASMKATRDGTKVLVNIKKTGRV